MLRSRPVTGYHILVMLHLLSVIGGFGALAFNALYMSLAQRRPQGGTGAILEVNGLVSGLAELLIYSALVFGVGAVAASQSTVKFSQAWVSAAFGVYLAAVGVLHGWVKRNQRSYLALVRKLETGAEPSTQQQDLSALQSLEKRVGFGWGVFNVLVIAAVYLMVFKPGG
jgi:uncharacterized membrane protein